MAAIVMQNGEVIFENIWKESNPYGETNPFQPESTPTTTEPEEIKEEEEEKEYECTLKFRRTSDYGGNFGFDWLREGDTGEPLNPWYKEIMELAEYERYVANEYHHFDQPWRKKYGEYAPTERYFIPWLTILPGETARLRMKLEVGKPSDTIELKVTGSAAGVITLNTESVDANRTGTYYDRQTLEIICNGTFSSRSAIEAWNHGKLVGKILIEPNSKAKTIKVALVPTIIHNFISHYDFEGTKKSEITNNIKNKLQTLLKQVYIIPDFIESNPVDLTQHISNYPYEGKNGYKIFDNHFRNNERRKIISNGKSIGVKEDDKYARKNIFEYLNI